VSHRSEHGTTLLELLIAIAILGITGAALLGGMATGIVSSGIHREQADVGTVLASAVEAVKDQSRNPYRSVFPCAVSQYDPTVGLAPLPTGFTVQVTDVRYWDGSRFQPSCPKGSSDARFFTLQLVTVKVTSSSGQVSQKRSVVKRGP
jgi:prepilin-type N-terminal cleavage/methylation domain-containing protein